MGFADCARRLPLPRLRDHGVDHAEGGDHTRVLVGQRPRPWPTPPVEPADRERIGWVSPTYTRTRSVELNPETMSRNRCVAFRPESADAEAYRVVRARLAQRMQERGGNAVMVTSALPGEGKTLTAINLAVTFAKEYHQTVLLVDCDLRKQSVHKYLGCPGEKGIIDFLTGNTPVSELVTWPGIEKMTLISGGRLLHESAGILGSPRMRDLVPSMKGRYPDRYLIFDAPPILAGADVLTLAPLVDKILVVVQAGRTSMEDVRKALQHLPKDKIMGFVFNRSASPQVTYYYHDNGKRR